MQNEALQRYCKKYDIPIEIYTDFKAYCTWIMPKIDDKDWQWSHLYTMDRIDYYLKRGFGHLIIEAPQQWGKSVIGGRLLMSYYIGMNPDKSTLYVTNTGDTAKRFTKLALYDVMFSEKYKKAFPRIQLKYELDTKENTQETKERRKGAILLEDRFNIVGRRGQYNARGVGQSINGLPAHLSVADDYFANYEDAQSDIIREKTVNWYAGDVHGRSQSKSLKVTFSTRYHNEDVIGYIETASAQIKEQIPDYELPEKITFRAECVQDNEFPYDPRKKGEFLWDVYREKYLFIKYSKPIIWECVYQQNPINVAGLLLKLEHLKEYLYKIDYNNIFISIDTNMKATAINGDKAGITVWQYTHPHKYLITFINQQYNLVELMNCVLMLVERFNNYSAILIEGRASGDGLGDFLTDLARLPRVIVVEPARSKVERFQWCLPEFHAGNVLLPDSYTCPNIWEYKRQLLNFTGEKKNKDDLVDSTSMFLNYLRQNVIIINSGQSLVTYQSNVGMDVRRAISNSNYSQRKYIR